MNVMWRAASGPVLTWTLTWNCILMKPSSLELLWVMVLTTATEKKARMSPSLVCECHTKTWSTLWPVTLWYIADFSFFLSWPVSLSGSLPHLLVPHIPARNFNFSPAFFPQFCIGIINYSPEVFYLQGHSPMLTTINLAHINNSSLWTSEVSSELVPNIQASLCFVPNQNYFDNVPLP